MSINNKQEKMTYIFENYSKDDYEKGCENENVSLGDFETKNYYKGLKLTINHKKLFKKLENSSSPPKNNSEKNFFEESIKVFEKLIIFNIQHNLESLIQKEQKFVADLILRQIFNFWMNKLGANEEHVVKKIKNDLVFLISLV